MKKRKSAAGKRTAFAAFITAALLLAAAPQSALANIGPVAYGAGNPSGAVFVVGEGSSAGVLNETLTFDLSGIYSSVEALYTVENQLDEASSLQMAFPYLGAAMAFSSEPPSVLVDGKEVEYELHLGEESYERYSWGMENRIPEELSSLESLLSLVHIQEPYKPLNFSLEEEATLYTFQLVTQSASPYLRSPGTCIWMNMSFQTDRQGSRVILKEVEQYEKKEDGTYGDIFHGFTLGDTLEVLVIGDTMTYDYSLTASATDGELPAEFFSVTEESGALSDFLPLLFERSTSWPQPEALLGSEADGNSENSGSSTGSAGSEGSGGFFHSRNLEKAVYQQFLIYLDKNMDQALHTDYNRGYQFLYQDRLLLLTFQVDFGPGQKRQIQVRCPVSPALEMTALKDYTYTYDYLLSPASHWAFFGPLDIIIKPHLTAPVLYRANQEFTYQEETGFYTARLSGLPQEDLSFTLYTMTAGEYEGKMSQKKLLKLGAGAALIVLAVVSGAALMKRKKRLRRFH